MSINHIKLRTRGYCNIGIHPKLILNWIPVKTRPPITSTMSVLESFWNFAQITAVILPCSVQNFKTTCRLSNKLYMCRRGFVWYKFKMGFGRVFYIATISMQGIFQNFSRFWFGKFQGLSQRRVCHPKIATFIVSIGPCNGVCCLGTNPSEYIISNVFYIILCLSYIIWLYPHALNWMLFLGQMHKN